MKYRDFETRFRPFFLFSLQDILKLDPGFHRQRLHEWMQKGYIRKVVNGFYIFSNISLDERLLFLISNTAYAPSYVSLESALSYYGLIPEGVYEVTAVSSRSTRLFRSDVASFRYRHMKREMFWGYTLEQVSGRMCMIAEPEKAILDFLYFHSSFVTKDDMQSLRINRYSFEQGVDAKKIMRYAEQSGNVSLQKRVLTFVQSLS